MIEELFSEETKIQFKNRPMAVPYSYRIIYKISQVILIIGTCCKRGGCSNEKLHFISTALINQELLDDFQKFLNNISDITPIISFEPAITRAVNYAISEQLIEIQSSNLKLRLTNKGRLVYEQIMQDNDIMVLEKIELKRINEIVSDFAINRVIQKWEEANVKY